MRFHISTAARVFGLVLLAIGLFAGGYVAGRTNSASRRRLSTWSF